MIHPMFLVRHFRLSITPCPKMPQDAPLFSRAPSLDFPTLLRNSHSRWRAYTEKDQNEPTALRFPSLDVERWTLDVECSPSPYSLDVGRWTLDVECSSSPYSPCHLVTPSPCHPKARRITNKPKRTPQCPILPIFPRRITQGHITSRSRAAALKS